MSHSMTLTPCPQSQKENICFEKKIEGLSEDNRLNEISQLLPNKKKTDWETVLASGFLWPGMSFSPVGMILNVFIWGPSPLRGKARRISREEPLKRTYAMNLVFPTPTCPPRLSWQGIKKVSFDWMESTFVPTKPKAMPGRTEASGGKEDHLNYSERP